MNKHFIITAVAFIVSSCSTTINYMSVSSPEEGALKLTQYTKDGINILRPLIKYNYKTKTLNWYAPQMLAASPDGNKLTYITAKDNYSNISIIDIGGGKSIVQRTFNRNVKDMSYSPDGKYIVFTDEIKSLNNNLSEATNWNIYMINANGGSSVQQIVNTNSTELSPTFSYDGKVIYYAKSDDGVFYNIWSVNIDNSLSSQHVEGFTPSIIPNKNELLITRNSKDGSRGEIWSINIDTGIETLILNDTKKGFSSPRISPDGNKIICVGTSFSAKTTDQNLDLYLLNIDGSKLTQLTYHLGHDVSPVWSSDGKSIFFISQRGNKLGNYNIWKMELNDL